MKKICVFIGNRANYSSVKSVMIAIENHPHLELQIILGAAALLDRFGDVSQIIKKDGFNINFEFHNIIEGESPAIMAKTTGLGLIDASVALSNLKPDMVVVVGDRFEMMSVVIAAAYMNIQVVHTMGGEVTGTIDESIRHAITKFAHIHFPANEDARERIIKLGENEKYVFNVGCPRIDLVAAELENNTYEKLEGLCRKFGGVGGDLDLTQPFLLVSQHSVTTEFSDKAQINATLEALDALKMPTIMLWPNPDPGGDTIAKKIRIYREHNASPWLHLFRNLPTDVYIHLMNATSCLVGNSSSGVRDGAFIGTPVVNIGTRQNRRLRAENVVQVSHSAVEIMNAIKFQVRHGKYPRSLIYGDGNAGKKIADILAICNPEIQKTIVY